MKRLFTILATGLLAICAQAQMLVSTQFNTGGLPFALTNLNGLFNAQFGLDAAGKTVIAGGASVTNLIVRTTLTVPTGGTLQVVNDQYISGQILRNGDGTGTFEIASDTAVLDGDVEGLGTTNFFAGDVKIAGPRLLSANHTNSGNIQTATLNVTGATTLGTANVTSLTATQYLNAISLFSGPTNNYDLSKSLQHYITSTAMAITGFVGSGSTPALQPNSQLVVSNSSGSSVVLTFTSAITTPDGARAYTITNGTMRRFAFGTSTNTAGSMIAYTNVNPLNTYY